MITVLAYFIFSALFGIFAVVIFSASNSLVLSEYTRTGFCEIVYYNPLMCLFLFFIIMAFFSLVVGLALKYNTKVFLKRKQLNVFCFMVFCVSLIILGSAVIFAFSNSYCYSSTRQILDDVEQPSNEIPSQYMTVFPIIEKMDSVFSEQGANYSFSEQVTPSGKYIHAQNYSASDGTFFVYDMEFFESNSASLTNAFCAQRNHVINNRSKTLNLFKENRKFDDIEYTIYQYENYFHLFIKNNEHCFSVVFDNIDKLYDEPYDFETLSLNIYCEIAKIKEPTNNVSIWEEIVAGIGDGIFDFDALSWYTIS